MARNHRNRSRVGTGQANTVGGKALAQRGKFDVGAWRAGGPRAENLPARAGSAAAAMP